MNSHTIYQSSRQREGNTQSAWSAACTSLLSFYIQHVSLKTPSQCMQIKRGMNFCSDGKLFRTQSRKHLTNAAASAPGISMSQICYSPRKTKQQLHSSTLRKLFNCFCKSSWRNIRAQVTCLDTQRKLFCLGCNISCAFM